MIHIDFFLAIGLYLLLTTLLVIGHWIFYNLKEDESLPVDSQNLHQCPYCAYVFFDYEPSQSQLRVCPRCESYVTLEDEAAMVQKNEN